MHDGAGLFFIVLFPIEKKNHFLSQNFPFLIDV